METDGEVVSLSAIQEVATGTSSELMESRVGCCGVSLGREFVVQVFHELIGFGFSLLLSSDEDGLKTSSEPRWSLVNGSITFTFSS